MDIYYVCGNLVILVLIVCFYDLEVMMVSFMYDSVVFMSRSVGICCVMVVVMGLESFGRMCCWRMWSVFVLMMVVVVMLLFVFRWIVLLWMMCVMFF